MGPVLNFIGLGLREDRHAFFVFRLFDVHVELISDHQTGRIRELIDGNCPLAFVSDVD